MFVLIVGFVSDLNYGLFCLLCVWFLVLFLFACLLFVLFVGFVDLLVFVCCLAVEPPVVCGLIDLDVIVCAVCWF